MATGRGRHTFVVTVRSAAAVVEVEDVRTGSCERLDSVALIGACIESILAKDAERTADAVEAKETNG